MPIGEQELAAANQTIKRLTAELRGLKARDARKLAQLQALEANLRILQELYMP